MNSPGFDASCSLSAASVQDIQLELIRRTRFNAFDGERIVNLLLAHRSLWEAVMLDQMGFSRAGKLPMGGLIKLRDLEDNIWNADTLYVLAPDEAAARELAVLPEWEDWGGMLRIHADRETVENALGTSRTSQAVITIWWD
jgi:hypothetical protein